MQFTTTILALGAALSSSAMAANTIVQNNCNFPVYVQSAGNKGGVSATVTVAAKKSYSAAFNPAGAAVKLSNNANLVGPLTLEYTPQGATTYYDLSNNAGNPFAGFRNQLNPADASCPKFNCAPNDRACYSSGAAPKVKTCRSTSDLTVRLCA